ncbi:MAG: acetyl-CoA carboxylase biotin carboxyl carrier protein [Oscillospiraceae bacterium]
MADLKLTLDEIKQLMDKVASANLGELILEDGDFKLKICGKKTEAVPMQMSAPMLSQQPQPVAQSIGTSVEINLPQTKPEICGNIMKSPIVGTFYAAVSPDKPPFVTVGSKVKKGDVLFVIESMKLMNEIQSEFDGEVTSILVDNAQGVEYNQPIMVIQ